jgi:hypothetical protein
MSKKIAIGWFPAGELEKALAIWPNLLEGWNVNGYASYCHAVDHRLRQLELTDDAEVLLAPINVKHYTRWCTRDGLDAGEPDSRSKYASDVVTRGRGRPWPPKPGKRCWCGRDAAYETCCGRPQQPAPQ